MRKNNVGIRGKQGNFSFYVKYRWKKSPGNFKSHKAENSNLYYLQGPREN